MRIGVLGETEARVGDAALDLGSRKQRAIVAALALSGGRPVSYDALVDLLWGDEPPAGLPGTLHVYIAGLRRTLEPDRAPRAPATVLVTAGGGYALRVPPEDTDVGRFERAVTDAHRRLAAGGLTSRPALSAEELTRLVAELDAALASWRGTPYGDLDDPASVVAERARLEELRSVALEDRAVAGLALGEHGRVAGELEALTAAYPLRERLWGLRALALARSGRQADALEALRTVRTVLDEELGLDASPELRDLETAVLRQDPGLAWVAPEAGPATPAPTAPSPTTAAPATPPVQNRPVLPPWPLVGRDDQLARLESLLDQAMSGTPAYAALVGDPGIGKSRLCAELAARAIDQGVRVLLGRCSQDDGAPPLWPWQQVLRGLGLELSADLAEDEGAEFRTWEWVVARVAEASAQQPVVVVLDDLHWADPPTLRVLRLLVTTVPAAHLLLIATWRPHPEPTGALADVAETFARHHADRLALVGLAQDEAAEVVAAVTEVAPSADQAGELAARTDGNPFFLVEYARLAREGGDLAALLDEPEPPTAVNDVLLRRLERLPDESLSVLRWAGVVGREFQLDVLAEVADVDEDDILDRMDPVLAAGLVREDGIGAYLFGHALVRDAVYGGFSATRRARAHARVAEVLERRPDRVSETARHWLAAGPAHAARAWRAAAAAALDARRVHAHEQAASLLLAALDAQAADPGSSPRDRYDLLMDLAEAHRWRGDWAPLQKTTEDAIAVADEIGDVRLLARAASAMTIGALWQSAAHGQVHEGVVAALRRCLADLPPDDDPLRCRAMLSLANELYYGSTFEERLALIEEALAMARRLGDDELVMEVGQVGFVSLWRPDTTERRLALVSEAMDLAARLGHERAFTVAATLTTVAYGELGRLEEMWETAAVARDYATRLRIPYGLMVLESLELPWLSMAGRFEEAEAGLASLMQLADQMELHQKDEAMAGALMSLRL
ncbi:MAG: BTAD domain-containing putative transcriptional regulator [Nocardioidaceae bacterium]